MIELRNKLTDELIESHPLPVGIPLLHWLEEQIDDFEPRAAPPISIDINGKLVLQSGWAHVCKASDTIVIYPEPKVAAALVFVVKALATAAISYAISYLTAPKVTDNHNSTPEGSMIYSASAQSNAARLNGIIFEQFGLHKVFPNHLGQPYVYYEDNIQYYCAPLACGVGGYAVYKVSLGNTVIVEGANDGTYSEFGDFEYKSVDEDGNEDGNYWLDYVPPGASTSQYSGDNPARKNVYTSAEVGGTSTGAGFDLTAETAPGDWIGPYDATPDGQTATHVEVDFIFSQGLGKIEDNGSISARTVTVEVNWRDKDNSTWNVQNYSYTENTLDQLGKSEKFNIYGSNIEVRVRRNHVDSNSTSVRDLVQWSGLKAYLPHVSMYTDVSTMFVCIKGTNNLSSSASNKISVVQHRRLWAGAAGGLIEPTSSAKWAAYYAIIDAGHSNEVIDFDSLDLLDDYEFNGVIEDETTLWEALIMFSSLAYCYPAIENGKIAFVKNDIKSSLSQSFSPDNTISFSESCSLYDASEPDGVTIEYFDSDTWSTETVPCLIDDGTTVDAGITPEEIRALGVTNRLQAWRYGMRQRRQRHYLRRTWEIETEFEGLNCAIGDLVSLPGRNVQFGSVVSYDSSTRNLGVDRKLSTESGVLHYIELRQTDGAAEGPYLCAIIDEYTVRPEFQLSFSPIFPGSEIDPTLFKFGTYDQIHIPATVKVIEPSGDTVRIELVEYDRRVYMDDDSELPAYAA